MIISHSKNVCFWKVPRTGSTTVEMLIRLLAGLDLSQDVVAETHFFPHAANFDSMPPMANGTPGRRRAHITPETAIARGFLTQAQYDAYDHYCMVRDPVDRFISTYSLGMPRYAFVVSDILADVVAPNIGMAVYRPQAEYLKLGGVNAMPFSDYENSVGAILTAFGATVPDQIPSVTRRHPRHDDFVKQQATPADRDQINAFYADDAALNF